MTSKQNKFCGMALAFVTLGVTGCVSFGTSNDGLNGAGVTVVERSKERPPTWMEFDAAVLHDADAQLKLVETRTRILSLPIGVKETQLAAMESHRRVASARLKAAMSERASAEAIDISAALPELDRHVSAVIDGKHAEVTRISDIYFEKIVSDAVAGQAAAEFYQVHVLVQMPRAEFDTMVQQLAKRLALSNNPGLRRLGQTLLRNPNLSH
jgi:hypothetical protein